MKGYRLIIAKRAKDDVADAIAYYNGKQKNLGNRFKKAFKKAMLTLRETPFFQIRYKEFRVIQIRRFPYLIHYRVEETDKEIVVLAVICTHRDPETNWL